MMGSKVDRIVTFYELDRGVIKTLTGFNFKVRKGCDYRVCHIDINCDLVVWGPDAVIISNSTGYQAMIPADSFSELVLS